MADTFHLSVLTPLREVFAGEVMSVTVSGHKGDFGVLPGHVAYITAVHPGALVIETNAGNRVFAVSEGFAQVSSEKVSIIVSGAIDSESLDLDTVKSELASAEQRLMELGPQDEGHTDAEVDHVMALGKLHALEVR